jgi:hypothetical protein
VDLSHLCYAQLKQVRQEILEAISMCDQKDSWSEKPLTKNFYVELLSQVDSLIVAHEVKEWLDE